MFIHYLELNRASKNMKTGAEYCVIDFTHYDFA